MTTLRKTDLGYQIEIISNGMRSVVARINDHEICEEHGNLEDIAEVVLMAISEYHKNKN